MPPFESNPKKEEPSKPSEDIEAILKDLDDELNTPKVKLEPFKEPKKEQKNDTNVDNSSVILSNGLVTDDQFFDDFFGDDDE